MKVILKNADNGKLITALNIKTLKCLFDLGPVLSKIQQKEDVLVMRTLCAVTDTGIRHYGRDGLVMSNDPSELKTASSVYDKCGSVLLSGPTHNPEIKAPLPVRIYLDGAEQDTTLRLLVTAYPEGYLLNVGKTSTNILGVRSQMYFSSIGRANIHFGGATKARIFPTLKSLLDYLQKNRTVFEYLAKQGYNLSVEPTCPQFASDMDTIPTKDKKHLSALNDLLDAINRVGEIEEDKEEIELTGTATSEEMKTEAIHRMKNLRMLDRIIAEFKKADKIYMSEGGGVLYDANEDTKKALEMVREMGYLPYAVVHNTMEFGEVYLVLYVSAEKERWFDERPDRHGYCDAYVYNASEPLFSELGSVQVQGANGGLVQLS